MKTWVKTIYILIVLLLLVAGWEFLSFYRRPLGPTLGLPTATRGVEPTVTLFPTLTQVGLNPAPTVVPATATSAPRPLCGGPEVMHILAIGSDARGDHYLYGLSDIMRLVRVDFVNARVTILEMPRDLWVEIPGIADHYNITHGKLNQAYLYGNKGLGYYDGPGEGPGLLARTLNLNFGAQPDHYVAVNMRTFENIVDAIGGIDVYLPYAVSVRSPENPKGFHVERGPHHFDGPTALMVARIRQYHTFSRAENQNIILCALRKKLLSPASVPAIPNLIKTFQRNIQTDLSPEQLNQLACLGTQMDGRDIVFASFPIELFESTRQYDPQAGAKTSILEADFDILREYIIQFQQGTWPDPNLIVNTTPSPANTDAEFACED